MPTIPKLLGFRAHTKIIKIVRNKNLLSLLRKRDTVEKMIKIYLALLPQKRQKRKV